MIPVLTAFIGLGAQWLENRQQKSKAKSDQEIKIIQQAGNWEDIHAKNSGGSWKDEFWTIIFSIPLVLCFIPDAVDTVNAGFSALDNTPEWYRYALLTLVGASVGIRGLAKIKKP